MNSYISDFVPGDFILHFAGQGSNKFRLMKEYSHTALSTLMEEYSIRAVTPKSPTGEALAKFHSSIRHLAGF